MRIDVLDISHHNTVADFAALKAAGVQGIIAKASQGSTFRDPAYAASRMAAMQAGLLWGCYHFGTDASVTRQVDNFLAAATPGPNDLIALDYEDNKGGQMSLDQAKEFLRLVRDRTGRSPVLYTGNTIKDDLGSQVDPELVQYRLWLAQYNTHWVTQATWPNGPWLWQFTNSATVHGVTGGVDANEYQGHDLRGEWAGAIAVAARPAPPPPAPPAAPASPEPTSGPGGAIGTAVAVAGGASAGILSSNIWIGLGVAAVVAVGVALFILAKHRKEPNP